MQDNKLGTMLGQNGNSAICQLFAAAFSFARPFPHIAFKIEAEETAWASLAESCPMASTSMRWRLLVCTLALGDNSFTNNRSQVSSAPHQW